MIQKNEVFRVPKLLRRKLIRLELLFHAHSIVFFTIVLNQVSKKFKFDKI